MTGMRLPALTLVLLTLGATGAATAAEPAQPATAAAAGDAMTNPALQRAAVLSFMGVKSGDRVADVVSGRFVRALSMAVGPTGTVYAVEPAEVVKAHPQALSMITGIASQPGSNVRVLTTPINALGLPKDLDVVFIRQNYHDLHDKFMGPADIAGFNRAVYAALKPGGVFVVLDHAAAPGSGLAATETLHRIDPAAVKAEVTAAGFVLDGESPIFRNPADAHDQPVFAATIRGRTDQFLLRFRKPG